MAAPSHEEARHVQAATRKVCGALLMLSGHRHLLLSSPAVLIVVQQWCILAVPLWCRMSHSLTTGTRDRLAANTSTAASASARSAGPGSQHEACYLITLDDGLLPGAVPRGTRPCRGLYEMTCISHQVTVIA